MRRSCATASTPHAPGISTSRKPRTVEAEPAEAAALKRKQFALLAAIFERSMGDQPTMLWIEDAHWLDRSTAELLAHIVDAFADRPLLLVLTVRSPSENPWLPRADAAIRLEQLPLPD